MHEIVGQRNGRQGRLTRRLEDYGELIPLCPLAQRTESLTKIVADTVRISLRAQYSASASVAAIMSSIAGPACLSPITEKRLCSCLLVSPGLGCAWQSASPCRSTGENTNTSTLKGPTQASNTES
jgi:hypothetical protein